LIVGVGERDCRDLARVVLDLAHGYGVLVLELKLAGASSIPSSASGLPDIVS
jgi:hypothetical protein